MKKIEVNLHNYFEENFNRKFKFASYYIYSLYAIRRSTVISIISRSCALYIAFTLMSDSKH